MSEVKPMWRWPWRYRESLLFTAALIAGGFAAQLAFGPFDFYLLRHPVNYILGIVLTALILLSLLAGDNPIVRWLSGAYLVAALLAGLLLFTLIMGLTPQLPGVAPDGDIFIRLGFTRMTTSWPFVLLYFMTLVSLGLAAARRLRSPGKKLVFILNHGGLWLVLAAAGLGAADREQYIMHVREGEVEWRVYTDDQQVLELPLAIRLDDFDLEEYEPKLAVIDRHSGLPQPEGNPALFQLADYLTAGLTEWRFGDWDISVEKYIAQAAPSGNGAYSELPMPGASPAARVLARHRDSKVIQAGWVSGGSQLLPVSPLALDDDLILVMTKPEAKRFVSRIKVFTRNGREEETALEVNQPLKVENWQIYQYGYDNKAGRMSTYSSFELVSDPWLPLVQAGLILWALGSLGLIYQGKGKQKP
ncbi:MAG: cytochrome c biogenesis protein ResB [Candidatus Adiutrix sp.]|jgi:hypothetical protein|nr:cytochrome c biogenesis protein ResB [Candidatus Adiutrix sp.]